MVYSKEVGKYISLGLSFKMVVSFGDFSELLFGKRTVGTLPCFPKTY